MNYRPPPGLVHECLRETHFGVELPCAVCSEGEFYALTIGPVRGYRPSETKDLSPVPIRTEVMLRKRKLVIMDDDGRTHMLGTYVLERVDGRELPKP